MKLLYLRYFQTVCEFQNVTQAAKALHISQPTITYAIKELEKEFNLTLFTRKSHGFALTKEGEQFQKICLHFLRQADNTEAALHDLAGVHSILRVGVPPMMGMTIYSQWYDEIHREFPDITIQRHEHGSVALRKQLINGQIDCAIFPQVYAEEDTFCKLPIAQAEYVCCVGMDHPFARRRSVTVEEMQWEPFVLLDNTFANNRYVHQLFASKGLTPNVVVETNQFSTIERMVSSGGCITMAYQTYVDLHPNSLIGIPVEGVSAPQTISLIWLRDRYQLSDLTNIVSYLSKKDTQYTVSE